VTPITVDLDLLHLPLLIYILLSPWLAPLAPHMGRATLWATHTLRSHFSPGREQHLLHASQPRLCLPGRFGLQPCRVYGRLQGAKSQLLLRNLPLPRLQPADQYLNLPEQVAQQPTVAQPQLPGSLDTQPSQHLPYNLPTTLVGRLPHLGLRDPRPLLHQ